MRNSDRPVTRSLIIEHVWDIHFDSVSNVVEVHVNSLRNKIDRGFAPPLIHTVRGVGYMLADAAVVKPLSAPRRRLTLRLHRGVRPAAHRARRRSPTACSRAARRRRHRRPAGADGAACTATCASTAARPSWSFDRDDPEQVAFVERGRRATTRSSTPTRGRLRRPVRRARAARPALHARRSARASAIAPRSADIADRLRDGSASRTA